MEKQNIAKDRLLYMYNRLVEGKAIYKEEELERHKCSNRSLQRDIEDLRNFFYNQSIEIGFTQELIYDKKIKGYRLVPPIRNILTNEEVFAVLKILLESRAFTQKELNPILDKLIDCCVPRENKRQVTDLISNERYHYVEPQHKSLFLKKMWDLSGAIKCQQQIEIVYKRNSDGKLVEQIDSTEAAKHTKVLGVTLTGPVLNEQAVTTENVPTETDAFGEVIPVSVTGNQRLSAALQILEALENNDIVGEAASVDVSSLSAIELWYGTRYQVNLGDNNDMERKIASMYDVILQLSNYQTGRLDCSFTTWQTEVGYTPFE